MTPPRVRFLIGGVQKAGTTALAQCLAQHPHVRLPATKEAHVFDAPDFDDGWSPAEVDARYATHFPLAEPDAGILHGDATPIYVLHPRLMARIARYNPQMRWILLLRDPATRAISHYHMERARGGEGWPLWPALLLERWRLRGHADDFSDGSPLRHHSYRLRGDYARQLDALYAYFPREQVLLLHSAQLRNDATACVRSVLEFLGMPAPAQDVECPQSFVGDYAAPSALGLRLLRWLMRRELRELRDRHGISFTDR